MNSILFKTGSTLKPHDLDEEKGIVKGLGSVFGNIDSDGDIILKGAFSKSLVENQGRIKYHKQHMIFSPIGTFSELFEDQTGLRFTAQLAMDTIDGRDMFEQIKFGLIDENSVGFRIIQSNTRESDNIREITEAKLFEISAVTLAANSLARITEVKGGNKDLIQIITKRYDNVSEIIRKGNISDSLGLKLEYEILSLKDYFVTVTQPSKEDTEPTKISKSDFLNQLQKSFKH